MNWLCYLKHWWRARRYKPALSISYGGQCTPRPQVHVSAHGYMAAQGVYTFDWTPDGSGDAKATMYARDLATVLRCRLVDERPRQFQPIPPESEEESRG